MASLSTLIKKATEAAKKAGVSDSTINKVSNSVAGKITKATASALDNAVSSNPLDTGRASTPTNNNTGDEHGIGNGRDRYGDLTARPGGGSGGNLGTPTNYGTYQQDLDRLTKAQRQAQVDQLKAARTQALANLDVQEQNIKPMYETARNQTSAASQQGARNLAEYLANRGLTNSGAAAQGEINRLSTLSNNLGNLANQEANAYRDIANQRTAVENNYISGLANANNAITSNYYNNLLNYNEQQRQAIQALQNQANYQYYDNIQARINELLAQGYSPNSYEVLSLQALRGNKVNNQYNSAMANAQNNVLAGNINYNNAAQLGMTVPQAQQYASDYKAAQEATAQAEQEALNRQIAQQNWENAYKENQLQWNQNMDYNNYLLNQQKVANDTAMTNYNINKPYYKPSSTPTNTNRFTKEQKQIISGITDDLKYKNDEGKIQALNNRLANGLDPDIYAYLYGEYYNLPIQNQ